MLIATIQIIVILTSLYSSKGYKMLNVLRSSTRPSTLMRSLLLARHTSKQGAFRLFSTTEDATSGSTTKDATADLLKMELPTNDNSPLLLKLRHTSAHVYVFTCFVLLALDCIFKLT